MLADPIQFASWEQRELPPIQEVARGVWAIPVPCAPFPVRFTFAYLLVGRSSCLLIDPGWYSLEGWQHLERGLHGAGRTVRDIEGIVITHAHPDHIGMANAVAAASGAWTATSRQEADELRRLQAASGDERSAFDREWFSRCGIPLAVRAALEIPEEAQRVFSDALRMPERAFENRETLEFGAHRLRMLVTPGHTRGHLCVYDEVQGLLFAGDHVLPQISPNVGIHSGDDPDEDRLHQYLESLEALASFLDPLVLPAHEYAFRGLAGRSAQLRREHAARGEEIVALLAGAGTPLTIWSIATQISWSRNWEEFSGVTRRLALAETQAHVRHLLGIGKARRKLGLESEWLVSVDSDAGRGE